MILLQLRGQGLVLVEYSGQGKYWLRHIKYGNESKNPTADKFVGMMYTELQKTHYAKIAIEKNLN